MSPTAPNRLNLVVNIAILAAILILLFGPTGPLGRWFVDWRASSQQRGLVESAWNEMVEQATIISNVPAPPDTVAVFTDYECPFCRSAEPALREAVAGGLAIALLHLPLDQIHPRARAAASAAICAEGRGMFAEIHHALMETDEWMDGGDWEDFASKNGISDPEAFVSCMASEPTASRVTANVALATLLGINGTPAYVMGSRIEMGASGLQSVLSLVGTAVRQEPYELGEVLFESDDFPHEEVSTLGSLADGLMLGPDRIVLADGMASRLFFVDIRSGKVTAVGRRGEGPGDFQGIRAIGRADPGGVFVDDPVGTRVTVFTDDGSLVESIGYNPLEFRGHVMIPRPLGVYADGTIIFRDADPMFSERPPGPYREKVDYVALMPDGSRVHIAEAPGREMVRRNHDGGTFSNYEKPFSYSSLDAVLGDLVLVANTESGSVSAYNRSGDAVMEFGFGPGLPVTSEIAVQWREERVARTRERGRGAPLGDAPAGLSALLGGLSDAISGEEEFYRNTEGNTVTPALSRMLVDGDGAVWVQRFALPSAEKAVWQRWRPSEDRLDRILDLPADYRLLDALGNRVLLRTTDELGVPKAIVATVRVTR